MANKKKKDVNPGIWGMIRDLGDTSMRVGQFPLLCFVGFACLCVYRMSGDQIFQLINRVFDELKTGYYLGYIWGAIATGIGFVNSRYLRRLNAAERKRFTEERQSAHRQLVEGNKN